MPVTCLTPVNQNMKWPVQRVRQTFIEYFERKQHEYIYSSPTIPHDDPTLMFANSGMNQFKPIFLGTVDQNSKFGKLKRAANTQKCIRAGGKHNDLDDVGKDTYHHTFFEMLGNWSFGDYFKQEAIEFAWELLTKVYCLDANRLYVTYFEGTELVECDNEARDIWLKLGVPENRLIACGPKENFWEMGETGPCGPCSEIHYDLLGNRFVPELVNKDDPTLIEIWNLVFMQFNRLKDGSLESLPAKHVDTGMGLERIVCCLQQKTSNYDTDVFQNLFLKIQELTQQEPYMGTFNERDIGYRVVADHVRTLVVAMSDGGYPSNEGRGYVLRRILRRGCKYARKALNVDLKNFFSKLVDTVVRDLKIFDIQNSEKIKRILDEEESSFALTLERGLKLFDLMATKDISGFDAFRLYDTFGFPVDLTQILAQERNLQVDMVGFEKHLLEAKMRSRANAQKHQNFEFSISKAEEMNLSTNDDAKYSLNPIRAKVIAVYTNTFVNEYDGECVCILDKTNFYSTSGGQESDTGVLFLESSEFKVSLSLKMGNVCLHFGVGKIKVGDEVECQVDLLRRQKLSINHTATHVLNYALSSVLGNQVEQKGSLVSEQKLRFDFNSSACSEQDLQKIFEISKQLINEDLKVYTFLIELKKAKNTQIKQVFGEIYPDLVRAVSIGIKNIMEPFEGSVELCGGTHVESTREISDLVFLEEQAIAKGIRRITAVTHDEARKVLKNTEALWEKLNDLNSENLRQIQKELDETNLCLLQKFKIRQKVLEFKNKCLEAQKLKNKSDLKEILQLLEQNLEIKVNVDPKVIQQALSHVQKLKKGCVIQNKNQVFVYSPDQNAKEYFLKRNLKHGGNNLLAQGIIN